MYPKYAGYQEKAKKVKAINTAHVIQNATIAAMDDCDTDDKMKNAVKELTGADIVSVSRDDLSSTGTLKINYKSDGKNYNIIINLQDSSYVVNQIGNNGTHASGTSESQIYTSNENVKNADEGSSTTQNE